MKLSSTFPIDWAVLHSFFPQLFLWWDDCGMKLLFIDRGRGSWTTQNLPRNLSSRLSLLSSSPHSLFSLPSLPNTRQKISAWFSMTRGHSSSCTLFLLSSFSHYNTWVIVCQTHTPRCCPGKRWRGQCWGSKMRYDTILSQHEAK